MASDGCPPCNGFNGHHVVPESDTVWKCIHCDYRKPRIPWRQNRG